MWPYICADTDICTDTDLNSKSLERLLSAPGPTAGAVQVVNGDRIGKPFLDDTKQVEFTLVSERFLLIPLQDLSIYLPLNYRGNPGVNDVSYRGANGKRSG
jgi:hypothetical protein